MGAPVSGTEISQGAVRAALDSAGVEGVALYSAPAWADGGQVWEAAAEVPATDQAAFWAALAGFFLSFAAESADLDNGSVAVVFHGFRWADDGTIEAQ